MSTSKKRITTLDIKVTAENARKCIVAFQKVARARGEDPRMCELYADYANGEYLDVFTSATRRIKAIVAYWAKETFPDAADALNAVDRSIDAFRDEWDPVLKDETPTS
jgi:hypothetical protein